MHRHHRSTAIIRKGGEERRDGGEGLRHAATLQASTPTGKPDWWRCGVRRQRRGYRVEGEGKLALFGRRSAIGGADEFQDRGIVPVQVVTAGQAEDPRG